MPPAHGVMIVGPSKQANRCVQNIGFQHFRIFAVHGVDLSHLSMQLSLRWFGFFCAVALLFCGRVAAQKPAFIHMSDVAAWELADNDTLYVLNFWATWCKPCVAEMPYFDQVQKEMAAQKVKVIFISMDFRSDYEKRLVPFVAKRKFQSQIVLLDEPKYNDWIDKVSTTWSGAIPATLIVQHSKGIRAFHEGEYTYETLKSQIDSLIQQ
jgi:thiol-disulfide isomerase/thioredoxin